MGANVAALAIIDLPPLSRGFSENTGPGWNFGRPVSKISGGALFEAVDELTTLA